MTPAKFKAGDRVDCTSLKGAVILTRGKVISRKWAKMGRQWLYIVSWGHGPPARFYEEARLSAVSAVDQLGELAPTAPAYHEPLTGGTSELPDSP